MMPRYSDETLRGMLLEEAILYILSKTGYAPVFEKGKDPSLADGKSGLEVYGRGAKHQIDAVADFIYTPPFSNQLRLLIEAKFRNGTTGINVVRNAAGTLKDVSEYWVVDTDSKNKIAKKRFHYLYAIFSKSPFTAVAQKYAYAQDIFLLPLENNSLFKPIINAISNVSFESLSQKPELKNVRKYIRHNLHEQTDDRLPENSADEELVSFVELILSNRLAEVIRVCKGQGFGFIAMMDGQFPVFLSGSKDLNIDELKSVNRIRIMVNDSVWMIYSEHNELLFTFDLPNEILKKYKNSPLSLGRKLLKTKGDYMSDFFVFINQESSLRIVRFILDQQWFNHVSNEIDDEFES